MTKCNLGKVNFQVNAVSGLGLLLILSLELYFMLVFKAYNDCRSSVAQALKRLLADSGSQPFPPFLGFVRW